MCWLPTGRCMRLPNTLVVTAGPRQRRCSGGWTRRARSATRTRAAAAPRALRRRRTSPRRPGPAGAGPPAKPVAAAAAGGRRRRAGRSRPGRGTVGRVTGGAARAHRAPAGARRRAEPDGGQGRAGWGRLGWEPVRRVSGRVGVSPAPGGRARRGPRASAGPAQGMAGLAKGWPRGRLLGGLQRRARAQAQASRCAAGGALHRSVCASSPTNEAGLCAVL